MILRGLNQVYDSKNANQKEKFEADLKPLL